MGPQPDPRRVLRAHHGAVCSSCVSLGTFNPEDGVFKRSLLLWCDISYHNIWFDSVNVCGR